MKKKSFPLAVILEATTGIALIQDKYEGLSELFSFMTGESKENSRGIGLIDLRFRCKPEILRQYPKLASVKTRGLDRNNVKQWLAKQTARFGKTLKILPMPSCRTY